jgi:hypothetical protein
MDNKGYIDVMDTMDNKAKKDQHNLKLSTSTFNTFHKTKNQLTLKLDQTKVENDIFLSRMLYFVEKNIDDFVISFNEISNK